MGKRIVITSLGSYGDVYPYIGLALGLKARGHEPELAIAPYYRDAVEREGLAFHPVRPDVDPSDRAVARRAMDPASGTEYIVRELVQGPLRESYADLSEAVRGADLLVSHPITFAGPIVARREGLPWVSTVLAPVSFFSATDLPVFPQAPWMKRLARPAAVAAGLAWLARRATRGWGEPVYALSRELGLEPAGNPIFEGQHSPYGVLALFSRLLADPRPDWPSRTVVTGPILYNGPAEESELSPDLEGFLAAGPPPIVFTLGTSAVGVAGRFFHESAEAVRRLGERAVLLVGSHPENIPRDLPPGVRAEPFASHTKLFSRARIVVHQGGAGTMHQALVAGHPALVVPHANDQPDNAYRLERLGTSRTLRPRRYTAARADTELRALIEDEDYRTRAAAVAEVVRAEDGVGRACDAIEEVLGVAATARSGDEVHREEREEREEPGPN